MDNFLMFLIIGICFGYTVSQILKWFLLVVQAATGRPCASCGEFIPEGDLMSKCPLCGGKIK